MQVVCVQHCYTVSPGMQGHWFDEANPAMNPTYDYYIMMPIVYTCGAVEAVCLFRTISGEDPSVDISQVLQHTWPAIDYQSYYGIWQVSSLYCAPRLKTLEPMQSALGCQTAWSSGDSHERSHRGTQTIKSFVASCKSKGPIGAQMSPIASQLMIEVEFSKTIALLGCRPRIHGAWASVFSNCLVALVPRRLSRKGWFSHMPQLHPASSTLWWSSPGIWRVSATWITLDFRWQFVHHGSPGAADHAVFWPLWGNLEPCGNVKRLAFECNCSLDPQVLELQVVGAKNINVLSVTSNLQSHQPKILVVVVVDIRLAHACSWLNT